MNITNNVVIHKIILVILNKPTFCFDTYIFNKLTNISNIIGGDAINSLGS